MARAPLSIADRPIRLEAAPTRYGIRRSEQEAAARGAPRQRLGHAVAIERAPLRSHRRSRNAEPTRSVAPDEDRGGDSNAPDRRAWSRSDRTQSPARGGRAP